MSSISSTVPPDTSRVVAIKPKSEFPALDVALIFGIITVALSWFNLGYMVAKRRRNKRACPCH